jgi:hypothetical protein
VAVSAGVPRSAGPGERASLPKGGTVTTYIAEDFDDGLSTGRGWIGNGLWHEVPFAQCEPGASGDAGIAWYFGQDADCRYEDNSVGSLLSPVTAPIARGTQLWFRTRVESEWSFDHAEVLVNGNSLGALYVPLFEPGRWHWCCVYSDTGEPFDLTPYVDAPVQVEFRFTSDSSVSDYLGWMVDDVLLEHRTGPRLTAHLEAPAAVRPGRTGTAWLVFGNAGDQDLPAPLFLVSNSTGTEMSIGTDGRASDRGLAILGVSEDGPAGVIEPGETERIPIRFVAPQDGEVVFNLDVREADATPVDWARIEPYFRPADVPDAEWGA